MTSVVIFFFTLVKQGCKIRNVRKVRGDEMRNVSDERFIVSVKVGPKGQITIPVEARKMFDIKEGETLMVMGDKERGLAIMKADVFYQMMGGAFNGSNQDN